MSNGIRSDHIAHLNMYKSWRANFKNFHSVEDEVEWLRANSFIDWKSMRALDQKVYYLQKSLSRLSLSLAPDDSHIRRIKVSFDNEEMIFDDNFSFPNVLHTSRQMKSSDVTHSYLSQSTTSYKQSILLIALLSISCCSNLFVLRSVPGDPKYFRVLMEKGFDAQESAILINSEDTANISHQLLNHSICEKATVFPLDYSLSSVITMSSAPEFLKKFNISLNPPSAYSDNIQRLAKFPCYKATATSSQLFPYLPSMDILLPPIEATPTVPVSILRSFSEFKIDLSSLCHAVSLPPRSSFNVLAEGYCGISTRMSLVGIVHDDDVRIYSSLNSLLPLSMNMGQVVAFLIGGDHVTAEEMDDLHQIEVVVASLSHRRLISDPKGTIPKILNFRKKLLTGQRFLVEHLFNNSLVNSQHLPFTNSEHMQLSNELSEELINLFSNNELTHKNVKEDKKRSLLTSQALEQLKQLRQSFGRN
ncbi:hypothetical protein GEMRC1_011636 [Eukaryota sp. GEM-RC1]